MQTETIRLVLVSDEVRLLPKSGETAIGVLLQTRSRRAQPVRLCGGQLREIGIHIEQGRRQRGVQQQPPGVHIAGQRATHERPGDDSDLQPLQATVRTGQRYGAGLAGRQVARLIASLRPAGSR